MRITQYIAPVMLTLCSCVSIVITDGDGGEMGTTSEAGTSSEGNGSTGIGGTGQESDGATTRTSTSGDDTQGSTSIVDSDGWHTSTGTSSDSTSTGEACEPNPRPYGACDLACGDAACDGGRTCIGDPVTGEASCADPCESAQTCPSELYPEPWAVPVCQPATMSGLAGSWCSIACADGACPNITVCTPLGGDAPVCVGEA